MKKKIIVLLLTFFGFLLLSQVAYSQIIDDTTKLFYSPKTTLQLYEQDVLRGRYVEQPVDTSLYNLQNERYWFNDTIFYQHLGNVGTASQPLYYHPPQKIGVRLGKNIYDRYAYDPDRINYFNTRSPYTHLYYVQGTRGEQIFEALHTRNITPRWNAGVAYQILSANQQIGPAASDRNTRSFLDNQAIKAFTHFRSENENYNLFVNFTFMRVEQAESGGIIPDPDTVLLPGAFEPILLPLYEEAPVQLINALNEETRNNLHLMQIYRLAKENLKVYHVLDWRRQQNVYEDINLSAYRAGLVNYKGIDTVFTVYPNYFFSSRRTKDATNYRELQNTFGLTGNYKQSLYNVYARLRNAQLSYSTELPIQASTDTVTRYNNIYQTDKYNQVLIGGDIRLMYKEIAELTGEAEYQLGSDYRVKGRARIGGAFATLERTLYSPTRVENHMLSNHFMWDNDFETSVTDRIGVGYVGALGTRQYVKLNAHYTNIKRYVYFDENALPQQLSGNQRFWGADLSHHIRFGAVHFKNLATYTNNDEANRVRMPDWLLESTIYIQGFLFKKALYSQLGVQGTYMSRYYADAYMPVTQQFYVQNQFEVQGYPVLDVFLTADIKTVNLFLKMSHVNSGLLDPVYYVTPYYPGMRRSFVFGLKWMFFD